MRLESSSGLEVSIFEAVLACGQAEARIALVRQLAGLLADPEAAANEKDQVIPVLVKATADGDAEVRKALAEELLTIENLHPDLLFAVVADEDAIAIPFLNELPSLSGWHMLTILRVGDDARQAAVAGRPDLSAETKAYIVKSGSVAAVTALLANPAIKTGAAELRAIYARLGQSEEVVEILLSLSHLPSDIRIRQARKTSIRMRQMMAERGWLAANDVADLVADAEEKAVLQVISEATGSDQQEALAFLAQNNMLTSSLVMRAASIGDVAAFAATLSHLTGQTAPRITDFILGRGGPGIRSLLNRSGLPGPCHVLLMAAADVACEFRNLEIVPEAESFGRRLLEVLMMQFGALPLQEQARQIEFVGRFADPKVRKIARQIKIDMLRAA
jgi:uncharacterized protein (DUF2336 family)